MNEESIWKSALAELELTISPANFQTWFNGKTKIIDLREGTVSIGCNSSYTKAWLQSRYYNQLKSILDKLTDCDNTLLFSVIPGVEFTFQKSNKKKQLEQESMIDDLEKKQEQWSNSLKAANLYADLNFDSFIVSTSNQLVYAVATSVCKNPDSLYNPFFICGPVGMGKTHILQAIGNAFLEKNPSRCVLYQTAEGFTNDLVESIRTKQTSLLRRKYRNLDLLLLDEIPFLSGRESTQEEFFHTFNELYARGSQIVISSDRLPSELPNLQPKLVSRLSGGMIAKIENIDIDLSEAILRERAAQLGLALTSSEIRLMAERFQGSIRDLVGTLTRLSAHLKFTGKSFTPLLFESFLNGISISNLKHGNTNPEYIIRKIAGYFSLDVSDLAGSKKTMKIAAARQLSMYILRVDFGLKLKDIATLLGRADHTTVMHGVEKIARSLKSDKDLCGVVGKIRSSVHTEN